MNIPYVHVTIKTQCNILIVSYSSLHDLNLRTFLP